MNLLKKRLIFAILVTLAALLAFGAASADQGITLKEIGMKMEIPDNYTILTKENLSSQGEFLSQLGKTPELTEADWTERGVVLQAWTPDGQACLEVRAVQDDDARAYYDLDQQPKEMRGSFRNAHLKNVKYKEMGYTFKNVDWKRQTLGGNFLVIKYFRKLQDGSMYWGVARKTVRNGFTITLDYQVYEKKLWNGVENKLNKIANRVEFTSLGDVPETATGVASITTPGDEGQAVAAVVYTAVPPAETDTGEFTVEGSTLPGAHLIAVEMRMATDAEPQLFETDAGANGKFKLKVKLPEEGVWLMTMTVENGSQVIAEQVFDTTTYNNILIPVRMERDIPEELGGNETVLSGVTINNVTVQCIVMANGSVIFDKTARTNRSGKFKFTINTSLEAEYNITLVFSKKNYDTRRMEGNVKRELTQADRDESTRKNALKPAYSALTKKMDLYVGKALTYKVYLVKWEQIGDEWVITAALRKAGKGYRDYLVIVSDEEPKFEPETQHKVYGTLTGSYQVQSEEGDTAYPSMDLLFWDD